MSTLVAPVTQPAGPDRRKIYTAEELLAFPPEWHFELIRGRLRDLDMPTGRPHGSRTNRLSTAISVFVYDANLGECFAAETGFLLARSPDTVKAPDFAFVSHDRLPEEEPGYAEVTPNLVIETRSPSDRGPGVTSKIQEWLAAGVQMAIDLDPERRTLTVHRPGETPVVLGPDDTLDGYDVLPGFSLPLSRLFP